MRPKMVAMTVVAAVGALALVVVVTVSIRTSSAGQLRLLDGPNYPSGSGQIDVPIGKAVTFETFPICATKSPITVTGVHLDNAKGIEVVDWASRRNPPLPQYGMIGQPYGKAVDQPGFSSAPIHWLCSDKNFAAVMDVALKTTQANGIFYGIQFEYAGGSLTEPFGVNLCQRTCPPGYSDPIAGH